MNCNSSLNLPPCYLLAIPLLPPYYRLTSIPIFYFHRTSTTYSQHIAYIYTTYTLALFCIYQKTKYPSFSTIMNTLRISSLYLPWTYLGHYLDATPFLNFQLSIVYKKIVALQSLQRHDKGIYYLSLFKSISTNFIRRRRHV